MTPSPDMSYLCRDWTPTVDEPVTSCYMPAGKAVRIEMEIAKYQPAAVPTLLLQAELLDGEAYLWDLTEGLGWPSMRFNLDPRHPYFRRQQESHRLDSPAAVRVMNLSVLYDPAAGLLDERSVWMKTDKLWRLRIGCPKHFTGMVTPLGSVITCRWEILDPKGGPT